MKIIIEDKFGRDRQINFSKIKIDGEEYFELTINCAGELACCFDLDILELEKLIKILKKS